MVDHYSDSETGGRFSVYANISSMTALIVLKCHHHSSWLYEFDTFCSHNEFVQKIPRITFSVWNFSMECP